MKAIFKSDKYLLIGNVRLRYAWLFKEDERFGKYKCMICIPKTEKEVIKTIQDAIKKVLGKEITGKGNPFKDGDKKNLMLTAEDKKQKDEYKNAWFIAPSSKYAPDVFDEKGEATKDENVVYSGCFVNIKIELRKYSTNDGVSAYLQMIQKVSDGEKLGTDSDGGHNSNPSEFSDFGSANEEDDL